MPDSGKFLFLDHTPYSAVQAEPDPIPEEMPPFEALSELVRIILDCGQNPVTQLAGYLIAEDPTYLPDSQHARTLARRIGRDKLLEALIELYLHTQHPDYKPDDLL
jgi:uncharacterized protein (UPF0297 family)